MQDGFRELLHLWKFNNRPNLSRFLASLFKEAMIDVRAVPIASGTRPLLIPIPTLGHAINPDAEIRPWLRNSQKRQSHHQLSRALRWANSEGRFVGDPRIQGRKVVLIDDVMTTGATVSSAAHACHLAGARSVYIWCLARTPAPPSAG
jgi:predicted amidophosphoribosyltransferase